MQSKSRKTVFKIVVVGITMLVIAGIAFEQIGQHQDRHRYAQVGRSVDIGGRTLNIFCSGEGGPAVVFDTFGHMSGYSWSAIQSEVAKFYRACWYDRAAYGWSDSGPLPRTFQLVASDLHALLHAATVPPPYVLVGAGDAALHIRVFHGLYPGEVAGVVMVNANDVDDPQTEALEPAKNPWAKHFGSLATRVRGAACLIFPTAARVGLLRLAGLFQGSRRTLAFGLASEQQVKLDFLSDNPTAQRGGEMCAREESMEQVRAAGNLGDRPLIVLSTAWRPDSHVAEGGIAAAWSEQQIEHVQPRLARLSIRSHLVVRDSEATPGAIIDAVHEVVAEVTPQEQK
jgi:hypothetical protein